MNSSRFHLAVVCFVLVLALAMHSALALKLTTPLGIYSYYEGLRGRLPLSNPAIIDDPLSLWINPAAYGTGRTPGFCYIHTYTDSTFSGDDALAISFGSFGYGIEFMKVRQNAISPATKKTIRHTLSTGTRLARGVYLGTSYSWFSSEIDELDRRSTFSAGLLLRPHRKITLGIVGRDLNSPSYYGNTFKPFVEAAVGIRPFCDRFTIFAGCLARTDKLEIKTVDGATIATQPKTFLYCGVRIKPLDGILLSACYDEDKHLSAMLSLSIGNVSFGSSITSFKKDEVRSQEIAGTTHLTLSKFWQESIFLPQRQYIELDLTGSIEESRPPLSLFGGGGPRYTLRELVQKIDIAAHARDVKAILLRIGSVSTNFAIADEIRQALNEFRQTGKKVVAYLENPGNIGYYIATASDYIILHPNGYIGLTGLKSETLFLKGTLEKLGIQAKYARVGKYKSAVEPLTQDRFTDPSREALNAVLDDIYEKFKQDLADGRGMSTDEIEDRIDRGPFVPSDALEANLVDTIAYWDQVPDILERVTQGDLKKLPYSKFSKRVKARRRWDEPPLIGIVYGVGGIEHGKNRRSTFVGRIMGSETTTEAIRELREDKSVKAIIFRVDSPGGMMTASDKIRREIELAAKQKPVIVSMGGVAGSGGYHISVNGTKILADEATITGSIGVLNLWLHTRGFYEKIGANKDIFTRGKHADAFPTWRDVTDEDIQLAQYLVDKYYDKFLHDVSKGRGMDIKEVDKIAQGRIWSGKRAVSLGLVDEIGGLKRAIEIAKAEAGIAQDEEVAFKVLPKYPAFLQLISSMFGARLSGQAGLPTCLSELIEDAEFIDMLDEPVLYLMPYKIRIK